MPIHQGGNAKLLRLHVQVSAQAANNLEERAIAEGRKAYHDGGFVGSASSIDRVNRAHADALDRIREIAEGVAADATAAYANNGFPGLTVQAVRRGTAWVLVVEGHDAEKYARILEDDTSGYDMHDFVRHARRRREIKVNREVKTKSGTRSVPRGKVSERQDGFYMVVPSVLGTVKRSASGKFEFTGRGGRELSRSGQDALKQFEATPESEDYYGNHDDPNMVSPFRTGEREVAYGRTKLGGKSVVSMDVTPGMAIGNELFERVKYATQATKAGEWGEETDARGNRAYTRETQHNPKTLRGGKQRANKRGAEMMDFLGVTNLRVNSPEISLKAGSSTATATAERQKGQVVSFITLSTRQPNRHIPGRRGLHILRDATSALRQALQDEVASTRASLGSRRGNFYERAYLETLESAAR